MVHHPHHHHHDHDQYCSSNRYHLPKIRTERPHATGNDDINVAVMKTKAVVTRTKNNNNKVTRTLILFWLLLGIWFSIVQVINVSHHTQQKQSEKNTMTTRSRFPNQHQQQLKPAKRKSPSALKLKNGGRPIGTIAGSATGTVSEGRIGHDDIHVPQHNFTFTKPNIPKVLVLYFPQYHPDPINDKNWGTNFTDWHSLISTHSQTNRLGYTIPRPTELGYYDLRQKNVRQRQGMLANDYGIDGFIYHHYWFYDPGNKGPNLATPLLRMLDDGHPNLPFAFNWCAQRWTTKWVGKTIFSTTSSGSGSNITTTSQTTTGNDPGPGPGSSSKTIQDQYFNATNEEIKEHYSWLSQFFKHPNYIKIGNKPVMFLYNYDRKVLRVVERLSRFARILDDDYDGIHWIVGRTAAPPYIYEIDPKHSEFTSITEKLSKKTQTLDMIPMNDPKHYFDQSMTYPYPLEYVVNNYQIPKWCLNHYQHGGKDDDNDDDQETKSTVAQQDLPSSMLSVLSSSIDEYHPEVIGLVTSFDNTPRREFNKSTIYRPEADTPEKVLENFRTNLYVSMYYQTCCIVVTDSDTTTNDNVDNYSNTDTNNNDRFIVINAWNEWAEGMSIEPSNVYGRRFLEIIKEVKQKILKGGCFKNDSRKQ